MTSLLVLPAACGNDQRPQSYDGGSSSGDSSDTGEEDPGAERKPISVPGNFEAEHYFRASGVEKTVAQITDCRASEGSAVSLTPNEALSGSCAVTTKTDEDWFEYDVDVQESGNYNVGLGVRRGPGAEYTSLLVDSVLRDRVSAGSAFAFGEIVFLDLPLEKGKHTLRFSFDGENSQFDNVVVARAGDCMAACDSRDCGDDFCGATCGECSEGTTCSVDGLCTSAAGTPVERHGALKVEGSQIVDQDGIPVQLRGVSTQWLNWEQKYSTDAEGLKFMRDSWGLDVLRIANGVENDNGYAIESVRDERLALVRGIIEAAIELGVYVLVDWHTHEEQHLELAKDFFAEIALSYGKEPNIIYEPFNEPVGGSGTLVEKAYWDETLKPYHEEIVAQIRALDSDNLIVLGTPRWSQGVQYAAESPVSGTNLAYTLHFYSCSHTNWLIDRVRTAHSQGLPMFATEWAATHADGGTDNNPEPCIDAASVWHSALDEMGISSTAWKLSSDGDGSAILVGGPPSSGGWKTEDLSQHGQLVRELLQAPRAESGQ